MSKFLVPSPPIPASDMTTKKIDAASKPVIGSPLDDAFIARVYRSMLWFGAVITLLTAFGLRSAASVSSLVAGFVLAAALLRAQEIGTRALLRPKSQMGGMDARLFMVLLLPIKFILIVVALATLNYFKLIRPGYLALGFFLGQLVIVAKVIGWLITRAAKK
ncbi:hypothetical protein EON80_09210 [bacterium]|nr:MAG: hypothetical protein EON80_09210 [bacterium]